MKFLRWDANNMNKEENENDSARSKTRSRSKKDLADAKLETHVPCASC